MRVPHARVIIVLVAVLSGCTEPIKPPPLPRLPQSAFLFGPTADRESRASFASLAYPAEAPAGLDLDIIIVQDGNTITLTNRTPHMFENVQVWLNQDYASVIEKIDIGPGNRYKLNHFINEHGEAFPVGGLLTPDRSRTLVLVELYNPRAQGESDANEEPDPSDPHAAGVRHRLIVRVPEDAPGTR